MGREHRTHAGRRRINTGFWCESQKERDYKDDLDVGGGIILK
jgi:hypothetical protein